jgi:hypothetical protein
MDKLLGNKAGLQLQTIILLMIFFIYPEQQRLLSTMT